MCPFKLGNFDLMNGSQPINEWCAEQLVECSGGMLPNGTRVRRLSCSRCLGRQKWKYLVAVNCSSCQCNVTLIRIVADEWPKTKEAKLRIQDAICGCRPNL